LTSMEDGVAAEGTSPPAAGLVRQGTLSKSSSSKKSKELVVTIGSLAKGKLVSSKIT